MNSNVDNADIFLLSTNTETSVKQVLSLVEDIAGKKANVHYDEPLKGDIKRMRYDYSKAKEYLGYEPKFTIRDGIRKIIEYTQENLIPNKI
jgi:UDP-glucose 4-epimerase